MKSKLGYLLRNRMCLTVLTCTLVAAMPVHAQSNLGNQVMQGVFDVIRNQAGASGGAPSAPQQPALQEPAATYPTAAVFLDATRKGEFAQIDQLNGEGRASLARSIRSVLRNDYGVAPLPNNTACVETFNTQAIALLTLATKIEVSSLNSQSPSFTAGENNNSAYLREQLRTELSNLRNGGGWCDTQVMGQSIPHPYKQALPMLVTDYANATRQGVEIERDRRRTAYQVQQEQAAVQAAQRQKEMQARDAERAAREQRQIDAERTRIEQEQKQRATKEKNRVAG